MFLTSLFSHFPACHGSTDERCLGACSQCDCTVLREPDGGNLRDERLRYSFSLVFAAIKASSQSNTASWIFVGPGRDFKVPRLKSHKCWPLLEPCFRPLFGSAPTLTLISIQCFRCQKMNIETQCDVNVSMLQFFQIMSSFWKSRKLSSVSKYQITC